MSEGFEFLFPQHLSTTFGNLPNSLHLRANVRATSSRAASEIMDQSLRRRSSALVVRIVKGWFYAMGYLTSIFIPDAFEHFEHQSTTVLQLYS